MPSSKARSGRHTSTVISLASLPSRRTCASLRGMKLAPLLLVASLAACKPSSSAKPAEGSAAPAPVAHERNRGPAPALPAPGQAQEEQEPAPPPTNKRPWLDKNGDGVVTDEERQQARNERAARVRDRFDVNHDGKLTPDELAKAGSGGRGPHFDDPQAVDTNGDGEISPDELQAGMRELRMRRHATELNGADE